MRVERWNDWLRANRRWCDYAQAGYIGHTPESIFLTFIGEPLKACDYLRGGAR